ncbi:MAG: hypothetical protein E7439_04820 [Ruminococcaceae bacterium]|nr:hypothetical protein [Oscillospiraceae bacterium]
MSLKKFYEKFGFFGFFVKKQLTKRKNGGTLSFGTDLSNDFAGKQSGNNRVFVSPGRFLLDKSGNLLYNIKGITRLTVTRSTAGECDVI